MPTAVPASFSRSTWAEIDLRALQNNLHRLRAAWGLDKAVLAVVKANAYGHGTVPVARTLLGAGAQMLGVASVDEGLELRAAGVEAPILLLSAILPDEAEAAVRARLMPTVFTREVAEAVNVVGAALGRVADCHFKIDTGMGRLGVWHCAAPALWRRLQELPHLRVRGIYTHLACADEAPDMLTALQLRAFETALAACGPLPSGLVLHAANSAGALRYPAARFGLVRPGIALYGELPSEHVAPADFTLEPVMALKARLTGVKTVPPGATISYGATWRAARPSCVATVPVGYADGYPRLMSGRAHVLLRGVRCPVVGRVTMDQILIDCTDLTPPPDLGEIVTLFGPGLPAGQVARWAETISYEVLCGVAHRVPRVYKEC